MPPTNGLTEKQQRFVVELPVDWNRTEAAKRAGYSEKTAYNTAYQLMQREDIQQALEEELRQQQERTRINSDYVLYGLKDMVEWCSTEEYWSPQNVIKAYELIGKHFKMFTDKAEHTSPDGSMTPQIAVYLPKKEEDG